MQLLAYDPVDLNYFSLAFINPLSNPNKTLICFSNKDGKYNRLKHVTKFEGAATSTCSAVAITSMLGGMELAEFGCVATLYITGELRHMTGNIEITSPPGIKFSQNGAESIFSCGVHSILWTVLCVWPFQFR